jgi:L-alanine-DL-glutamate epimerase-like enolase superfamily enzyme
LPTYDTYRPPLLPGNLSGFLEPAVNSTVRFNGLHLSQFLLSARRERLDAWHLVGGLDPLSPDELTGSEPRDGHPVLLADWIRRDGLRCLKIKLRGNDAEWDFNRIVRVGEIGMPLGVTHLTADFNCTVRDPAYVCEILDRLEHDHPTIHAALLYVEQPFPYDLEAHPIDVREVSRRKPLFLDESAHDWRVVRLGRELGWTGVALKTCKTQTGALLSACWAQAHGMSLMVQDLTNPMLAQIPHCQLAAHLPTIMGIETNAMQFYPAASDAEATIHPGLYRRREGGVILETVRGPGLGYAGAESARELSEPDVLFGEHP